MAVRVLVDEDLNVRLRQHFGEDVEVETVTYRGGKDLENGELRCAATARFLDLRSSRRLL